MERRQPPIDDARDVRRPGASVLRAVKTGAPAAACRSTIAELEATFTAHGLAPGEALIDIVAIAQGHPQRTMLLAHHLYNLLADQPAVRPVDELAAAVLDLALAETADVHQATWEALDRAERAVAVASRATAAGPALRSVAERTMTNHSAMVALWLASRRWSS